MSNPFVGAMLSTLAQLAEAAKNLEAEPEILRCLREQLADNARAAGVPTPADWPTPTAMLRTHALAYTTAPDTAPAEEYHDPRQDPRPGDTALSLSKARHTVVWSDGQHVGLVHTDAPLWTTEPVSDWRRLYWEHRVGKLHPSMVPAARETQDDVQVGDRFQDSEARWWQVTLVQPDRCWVRRVGGAGAGRPIPPQNLRYATAWHRPAAPAPTPRDPRLDPQPGDTCEWSSPVGGTLLRYTVRRREGDTLDVEMSVRGEALHAQPWLQCSVKAWSGNWGDVTWGVGTGTDILPPTTDPTWEPQVGDSFFTSTGARWTIRSVATGGYLCTGAGNTVVMLEVPVRRYALHWQRPTPNRDSPADPTASAPASTSNGAATSSPPRDPRIDPRPGDTARTTNGTTRTYRVLGRRGDLVDVMMSPSRQIWATLDIKAWADPQNLHDHQSGGGLPTWLAPYKGTWDVRPRDQFRTPDEQWWRVTHVDPDYVRARSGEGEVRYWARIYLPYVLAWRRPNRSASNAAGGQCFVTGESPQIIEGRRHCWFCDDAICTVPNQPSVWCRLGGLPCLPAPQVPESALCSQGDVP